MSELREAIARALFASDYDNTGFGWNDQATGPDIGQAYYRRHADAVLAALRDVLAAAARDAEKVRRVEELAEGWARLGPFAPTAADSWRRDGLQQAARDINRALDGTS